MSDRDIIKGMLSRARTFHPDYQELWVTELHDNTIVVWTGPDDAEAVFAFNDDGSFKAISIIECHGRLEEVDEAQ